MANQRKAQDRAARNAALKEEERRRAKRGMILRVAAIAVALVAIVGVIFLVGQSGGDDGGATGDTSVAGKSDYGLTMGDEDAPHKLVVYEDFLCPYCGQFERASSDDLQKLADEGKVFVDYRPFVLLNDYSADALNALAVVKKESGDEIALEFHKLLFENQPEESASEFPDADALVDLAVQAGASEDDVRPGIEDNSESDFVDGATEEAADNGVDSTPRILLDGDPYQKGADFDEMAQNLVADLS